MAGLCHGNIDSHHTAESRNGCVDICNSDTSCNWWTFDAPAQMCFLFQECPELTDNCEGCISGQKGCQVGKFIGHMKETNVSALKDTPR